MVVFVDLDDAFADGSAHLEKPFPLMDPIASDPAELPTSPSSLNKTTDEIVNANRNGFSAALSCYPYVFDCQQPANKIQIPLTRSPIASSKKSLAPST
jgi:hypothetical protein